MIEAFPDLFCIHYDVKDWNELLVHKINCPILSMQKWIALFPLEVSTYYQIAIVLGQKVHIS